MSTLSMKQNQCHTDHVSISGHSLFLKEDINCPLNAQLFVELQHPSAPSEQPGSRHRCLVYTPWHYLAVRSYFCHVEFQISIIRLGNASLTIPAALTVLAICDRSKDGRARDGRRYNHNITTVVTNITQQHRITIIFTSNDGTHCL